MTKSEMSYVIAGGGTGGHVFPALALAGEIRKRRPGARIVFVGTVRGLETTLVPKAGYPLETIRVKGLVGKGLADRLSGAMALPLGCVDSWRLLSRHAPNAVVGVGGYASGPVVATAAARRLPTVIHESNAVPGLTNRLLARVATRVVTGTASAALPAAEVVGNPVREEFFAAPALSSRPRARRLHVLVVGGSQGSEILNRLVPPALAALRAEGLEFTVTHQAGRAKRGRGFDAADLERVYAAAGFAQGTVAEFLDDAPSAFGAADVLVSRSGAMTVAEIAASGRPALFIPFAAATHGHQLANARALEVAGGALVLEEREASSDVVAKLLRELLGNPDQLASMGEAARTLAKPDAASRFCDAVFAVETPARGAA